MVNATGGALRAVLPRNSGSKRRQWALHHSEMQEAIERVMVSEAAWPLTKLSFEFMVLTAARFGQVRGAAWSLVDMSRGVWVIPAGWDEGVARTCSVAC